MGKNTLFQDRILFANECKLLKPKNPIILTNDDYRFIIESNLEIVGVDPNQIIIEPETKNTAPAILAAALYLKNKIKFNYVSMPIPDHLVPQNQLFEECILKGLELLKKGELLTFGIKPTKPGTAYGYLRYI